MKPLSKIIIIFTLGLLIGGGVVYILTRPASFSPNDITRLKMVTEKLPTEKLQDEGVLYTNERHGLSFRYPEGLVYKEFDEEGGAQTIVFQQPDNAKVGFQIYIAPYKGSTITGDRILYDASGAVSDLKEENLREDFLVATFFSEAPILGKTREIWFLHNGYLFEVTTYAELDTWIRDIVKTIEFEK